MSNILIIKHGSLGDLIQANGAIKDIKNFYKNRKVFLLTSQPEVPTMFKKTRRREDNSHSRYGFAHILSSIVFRYSSLVTIVFVLLLCVCRCKIFAPTATKPRVFLVLFFFVFLFIFKKNCCCFEIFDDFLLSSSSWCRC